MSGGIHRNQAEVTALLTGTTGVSGESAPTGLRPTPLSATDRRIPSPLRSRSSPGARSKAMPPRPRTRQIAPFSGKEQNQIDILLAAVGDTVILTAAAAMLGYLWAVGRDDDDVV